MRIMQEAVSSHNLILTRNYLFQSTAFVCGYLVTVEMENRSGKLKWKTEMVKMKIVYCLVHTSLKRPPVKQDH